MTNRYAQRRAALAQALNQNGLHGAVFNPGPSMRYFFGRAFFLGERPMLALITAAGRSTFVAPSLEKAEVATLGLPQAFFYTEDPRTWANAVARALQWADLPASARLGIEPTRLRALELRLLQEAAPQAAFLDITTPVMAVRARKSATEVEAMRAAVRMAERAWEATLPILQPGVTERQVAAELTVQLLRHGSEPDLPFWPIVAFGPHSASPHAQPGEASLRPETPVLFDWGARHQGYVSDMTRMVWFGRAPAAGFLQVVEVVQRAVAAGIEAAQPGAPAGQVDQAARQVIEAAGYGPAFLHRTGHGLGLDVHEPPYLRGDNAEPLAPGMVFTVEPGVYLAGRWGVRIEEMVHLTPQGPEVWTTLPRPVRVVTG